MNYEEAQIFFNDKISLENFVTLLRIVADDDQQEGLDFIKDQTACDDYTANLLWAELKNQYGTEETNFILKNKEKNEREIIQEKYKQKMEEQKYRNNAECPYCHSKNTKKISGFSKAGSVALFGLFARGKVGKQWHCNQCTSDF